MNRVDLPLRPENSHFTDSQWEAIYKEGCNILVSASAGSGKTTVLVQRVIEKIKAGTNVDELLIVTYTEAAAKEMKERILQAIQQAISLEANEQQKRHLIQQLTLLPTASVSTLHAFCLQVIRKYYYLLGIDPIFRLLTDETEIALLKEDVWDEVREQFYSEEQSTFYQLAENFSNDRSDQGLTQMIYAVYEFSRANPNPEKWLSSLLDEYQLKQGVSSSLLYQEIIKPSIYSQMQQSSDELKQSISQIEEEPALQKVFELVTDEWEQNLELMGLCERDELELFYTKLQCAEFVRYPTIKRDVDENLKELNQQIKKKRDHNKKIIQNLQSGLFSLPPNDIEEILTKSQPIILELIQVGKTFAKAYRKRKEEKGVLDFNDLEHLTLQILRKPNKEGIWQASEASDYYRTKFNEVLVDEYQDINRLQENILYWLTQQESGIGNLFMVGDVKQSIYSFRLADPTLFIEKYNVYAKKEEGHRIILAENFRSRQNILDFTNLLFSQLMDESVGQMKYDEKAHLVHGFTNFPNEEKYAVELLIYESEQEENQFISEEVHLEFDIDDKTEGELSLVALKIKEMMQQQFSIYDKKMAKNRPITYSDIVLLTPTKKNNLVLLDIFKKMEIPIHVNDAQNYFQATEIRIMIALLHVIDNPYQDIPLAAVLRSPIVGLKENELSYIRLCDKEGSYYDALQAFLHEKKNTLEDKMPDLRVKTEKFMALLQKWRELSRRNQLVTLLWDIYQQTGFLDYVGGLPAGRQRQANLHALYERATSYEEMSFKGLFQFVRFVEKMQEKDKDLAEPVTILDEEDAVRVMTIHASKGLEFPVVFVLDLTRRFNLTDLRQRYLFDEHYGIGIQYLSGEERILYNTLPMLALKEVKKRKLLSEELRKLYVALTRAEQQLYLVGTYKNAEAALEEWEEVAKEESLVLPAVQRINSPHLMKWIGMSLIRHPDVRTYQKDSYSTPYPSDLLPNNVHFTISFKNKETILSEQQATIKNKQDQEKQLEIFPLTPQQEKALVSIINFEYPYISATKTTSYQSVSEIKRVFEDPDDSGLIKIDLENTSLLRQNRIVSKELPKPAFLQETKSPQAAEVGSATHLLLQMLPLDSLPTEEKIQVLKKELAEKKLFSLDVIEKISTADILTFFSSELGKKILKNHLYVKREQPFSMLMDAHRIFSDYPEHTKDKILIHGIIDGFLENQEELILYDFKTDFIFDSTNEDEIQKTIQRYSGQMNLYREALEQARNKRVTACYLVLLRAGKVIPM